MSQRVLVSLAVLCTAPSVALAEEMDKEPSLTFLWTIAASSALLAVVWCRITPWSALLTAPLPMLYRIAVFMELTGTYVGSAVAGEAGTGYIVGLLGAVILFLSGHVFGVSRWWRHRPTRRSSGRAASGAPPG